RMPKGRALVAPSPIGLGHYGCLEGARLRFVEERVVAADPWRMRTTRRLSSSAVTVRIWTCGTRIPQALAQAAPLPSMLGNNWHFSLLSIALWVYCRIYTILSGRKCYQKL